MIQDTRPLIRVVAGILLDSDGNYLLGSRPEGKLPAARSRRAKPTSKPCNASLEKNSASASSPPRLG